MPEIIPYLLKANLAIILFYLGYRLLLRRLTFYTLNRFYLLFALFFSFTYPLVDLAKLFEQPAQELPGEVVYFIPHWEQVPTEAFDGWFLLIGALGIGTAWFAIKFVIRLFSLRRLHGQSIAATWQWFRYRQVFAPIRPFSFWRNIYVNVHNHADGELADIFKHEQVHVRGLHTVDVLVAELCSALCWFNPGMWLLRHAIRENLEFITDRHVLRSGVDKQTYQYSLLGVGKQLEAYPAIAQGFNFKNLKRRIMMMNKKKSSRVQLGRYLLAIPVIAVFALTFTMSRAAYLPEVSRATEPQLVIHPDTTKAKRDSSVLRIVRVDSDNDDDDAPLMVLDGKELEKGFDISTIDSNTIESISVLKDASATTVYGERGVHGVVLITTSKGKAKESAAAQDAAGSIHSVQVVDHSKLDTAALDTIRTVVVFHEMETSGQDTVGDKEVVAVSYRAIGHKVVDNEVNVSGDGDAFGGALIVIDGKESNRAALNQLPPNTIDAINVLKGATAVDKYGEKGEKGAVEITTKR